MIIVRDLETGRIVYRRPDTAAAYLSEQGLMIDGLFDPGCTLGNCEVVSEQPTLAEAKAALQEAVRQRRWEAETGGIMVGAVPIRTDEQSQAKLNGALTLFQLDPTKTQIDDWEAVPGVFVTLSRAEIQATGLAVGEHIQACFARSRALCEAIEAALGLEELQALDINAGWPG